MDNKKLLWKKNYTDGSVTRNADCIGIAWVRATDNPARPVVKCARLKPEKTSDKRKTDYDIGQKRRRWAMRAEFLAVSAALNDIAPGSNVFIHTDHKEVARAISDPDAWVSGISNRYISRKKLRKVLDILVHSIERHEVVKATWVDDKSNDPIAVQNMRLAHNASVKASGSKKRKPPKPAATSNENALEQGAKTPISWPPKLN